MNITIPDTITIPCTRVEAKGHSKDLDLTALSPDLIVALIVHGAKQKINDNLANAAKEFEGEEEAVILAFDESFNDLQSGNVRFGAGGGGKRLDEMTKELRLIVANLCKAKKITDKKAVAEFCKDPRATIMQWAGPEVLKKLEAKAEAAIASRDVSDLI